MSIMQDPRVARHIISRQDVGVVVDLPEEDIAMLFAFFSRSSSTIEEVALKMFDAGVLESTGGEHRNPSDRATKFHQEKTIGFGHKSVADHAVVHLFVRNCSILAARDFMTARLVAATEKSTRYVDFSAAEFVMPDEIPHGMRDEYGTHCDACINEYASILTLAEEAIRTAAGERKDPWTEKGWDAAIKKRALDAVRDLLPASIRTNFGMSVNATAAREMFDKRQTSGSAEVTALTARLRWICRKVHPTLIPREPRPIRRQPSLPVAVPRAWSDVPTNVAVSKMHDWRLIQLATGWPVSSLIPRWTNLRSHHMPPDRSSEFAQYMISMNLPFTVARDLGRHRMMTSVWGDLHPNNGYQVDPIMRDITLADAIPQIGLLSLTHRSLLQAAGRRLESLARRLSPMVLQYACPLATSVPTVWLVSLRELVHIIGLRTAPQGAATYREVAQEISSSVSTTDSPIAPVLKSCTNTERILIGRPG